VAGNSPAGTVGGGLPAGPGFRVPCIIVSPWTAGGWVFSEPSDHTSHLRFLEAVTGVEAPSISAYRRQALSDLTGAFRFWSRSEPPRLPDTSGPLTVAQYTSKQYPLPAFPGADQTPPRSSRRGAARTSRRKPSLCRTGSWRLSSRTRSASYLRDVYTECIVPNVSVPLTLLGLLEREPSHGYDLKRDYDTYFGHGRQLPFGQVYATLGRLARDGKVVAGDAEPGDGPDRKRYSITDTGRAEVDAWLGDPIEPEPHLQTILFAKVMLALMLGKPAEAYLDRQRSAHIRRMQQLTELKRTGSMIDVLLADHALFHLEADLRWIDLTSARLAELAATLPLPAKGN
jgi:DNA-binding PadR family transcriptional regulator